MLGHQYLSTNQVVIDANSLIISDQNKNLSTKYIFKAIKHTIIDVSQQLLLIPSVLL
jgi:hypothetical protein